MNTQKILVSLMAAAVLVMGPAHAERLMSLNPALNTPTTPFGTNGYVRPVTAHSVTVPKAFLDKTYLFGAMVEASTDNFFTLGMGADPVKVRFALEGDRLLMLADKSDFVPSLRGASEDIINRFPAQDLGDEVEIDLSAPEVLSVSVVIGGVGYQAERPGYVYDIETEDGFLAYGEKFIVQTDGQSAPARLTLAVKYYFKEDHASTYQPREYSDEDFAKYGFFRTTAMQKGEDGRTKRVRLANRWDLSKKIVYTLHPSIPEKFRPAFEHAILSWNDVFERSHGIRPIEVVLGEEDQLPSDLNHHVLYWVDYDTPYGGGAIGPSTSHPDTGEIIDATVVFYAGAFRDEIASMRKEAEFRDQLEEAAREAGTTEARTLLQAIQKGELLEGGTDRETRDVSLRLSAGTSLDFKGACSYPVTEANAITARAFMDPTAHTDDELMDRIVREVVVHEIGHTLGLRHNFKASADAANIPEGETSTSVMDYVTSLQGSDVPGPYDEAAIAYGYQGESSMYEGKDFMFGTDGGPATDPLSNRFDSGDPLDFYTGQFKYYRKLRDAGIFRSTRSYMRVQQRNLESIRKYVGRSARSEDAFEFLTDTLTRRSQTAPFEVFERILAMRVLMMDRPEMIGREDPNATFAPLTLQQQAKVATGLTVTAAGAQGVDFLEARLLALRMLQGMNSMVGYKAVEAVRNILETPPAPPEGAAEKEIPVADAAASLSLEDQEILLRVKQTLGNYFSN